MTIRRKVIPFWEYDRKQNRPAKPGGFCFGKD
jgi:hypothetical protein